MSLTNFREIGRSGSDTNAGFQFEFFCGECTHTWKSPYRPYRKGQLAGLIYKFAYLLGDRGSLSRTSSAVAGVGSARARGNALAEAIELAEQRYALCQGCEKVVCEDCWDARSKRCHRCASRGGESRDRDDRDEPWARVEGDRNERSDLGQSGAAALKCPNCSIAVSGGRFCEECGFDMASTHKSCPGCGTLCARATRFCADCGHAF